MKLYILRHGDSPGIGEAGVATDALRPLSEKGRRDAKRAALYLAEKGGKPRLILASPLKRAQETARLASEALGGLEVRTYAPLSNQMTGAALFESIVSDDFGLPELLAVGHQPQLGELAHHLTGQYHRIEPAGQVAVDTEARSRLLWTVNPDELPVK